MSIFSKLFKRNKVNTEALGLINLNSFIVYPDKSFYEEEENKRVYREFTDSYKEVLNTHKTITSKDLNLKEEINVKLYTEIINKLLFELDYTLDLVNNSEERNNINIKILYLKLRHYQNEINNYKNEVFIKLKVLNELHKKYIFSKNKREAIKSEITNLEMNIVMCQNNFNALNMEINSYSSIINYSELKEADEEAYLFKRNKRLERYMNVYGLNCKSDVSISSVIANELILEKYLFTNNFDLESEFESIKETHTTIEVKIQKLNTIIDKYMALKEITSKENKDFIKTIYDYKYLSIKENHIKNLVGINFLTFYKEELEYYENLILSEIDVFAKDKDKKVLDIYSKEFVNFRINEYERLVKLLRKLISCSNQNTFENRIILGIIFSLNNPKIIKEFFEKFFVDRNYFRDAGVVFYEKLYDWEEYIPLKSVMQIYKKGTSDDEFVQALSSLYNLLYVECSEKEIKKMYEGVIRVKRFFPNTFDGKTDASESDYIREIYEILDCEECKIYIPSTLNYINLTELSKVYEQNDPRFFSDHDFNLTIEKDLNYKELYIVNVDNKISTLCINTKHPIEKLTFKSSNGTRHRFEKIIFDNILNEEMLNEECFYELLKELFYQDSQGYCNCQTKYIIFKVNNFSICVRMDYSAFELLTYFPNIYAEGFEVCRRKIINKILEEVYNVTQRPCYHSDVESLFAKWADIKLLSLHHQRIFT